MTAQQAGASQDKSSQLRCTDGVFLRYIRDLLSGATSGFGVGWAGRYWFGKRERDGRITLTASESPEASQRDK